jgi:hypothetical protein
MIESLMSAINVRVTVNLAVPSRETVPFAVSVPTKSNLPLQLKLKMMMEMLRKSRLRPALNVTLLVRDVLDQKPPNVKVALKVSNSETTLVLREIDAYQEKSKLTPLIPPVVRTMEKDARLAHLVATRTVTDVLLPALELAKLARKVSTEPHQEVVLNVKRVATNVKTLKSV